jgi:hypothetical protein
MVGARSSFITGLAVMTTAYYTPAPPAGEQADARVSLIDQAAPSPLSGEEADLPEAAALARRFNPGMALPIPDVWPVEVRYAWHDGSDLIARVDGDGPAREWVAVRASDLDRVDWSRLPHRTAAGQAIRYYVDAPGDDRLDRPDGISRWRQRWREIVQPAGSDRTPAHSAYPPTQYAHLYWWNRAAGLLAIQYWFYYPFNEWINRHEGDWERIQVILRGPSRLEPGAVFAPIAHQYFFHGWWLDPEQLVRQGGTDPSEDHPLVYVGGRGRLLAWSGVFSGASYPLPARFVGAGFGLGPFNPDEDVSAPARYIPAEDFQVILLPEPERLDGRRFPQLSWLRLPFYAGQRSVHTNPPGYKVLGQDQPPIQPAARRGWLQPPRGNRWSGTIRGERIGRWVSGLSLDRGRIFSRRGTEALRPPDET